MKVRYDRLLKLAKFLDELPEGRFNFGVSCQTVMADEGPESGHHCGTVGCAIGWTPAVFPRLIQWRHVRSRLSGGFRLLQEARARARKELEAYSPDLDSVDYVEAAVGLLGMSQDDADALFSPNVDSPADGEACADDATPKQVANRIRTYVAWHKKQAK